MYDAMLYVCMNVHMYVYMYNIICMIADTTTTSLKIVIKKNIYYYKQ
jgi:hypothetical protein